MPEMRDAFVARLTCNQAIELSLLVDLEARWENLRQTSSPARGAVCSSQELQHRQKAYETFRSKLMTYNDQHRPAHVPELLLNTPARLGAWCRRMRELYLRVEPDPRVPCPVHLLPKAYRWADRLALRMNKAPLSRAVLPTTVREAIDGLGAVVAWCDGQTDDLGQPRTFLIPPSISGEGIPDADKQ
jgi:hypothetical protein